MTCPQFRPNFKGLRRWNWWNRTGNRTTFAPARPGSGSLVKEHHMRRLVSTAALAAAIICAAGLLGTRAEAMPAPTGVKAPAAVAEPVFATCTRFWNGWHWVRRCVENVPQYGYGYYGPGYGYYGPGYGYYGYGPGWGWRHRYYGYW
jgi:hypothetical protein